MYRTFVAHTLSLLLGVIAGLVVTEAVVQAQTQNGTVSAPYLITQTGGWNKELKCAAQNVAFTISVDNAPPAAAAGVTWSPNTGADATTHPFIARFPQSQMPAAIRTVGPHTLAFIQPATTITLADGSPYTYPAATYSEFVNTLPDTPVVTPPKDNGWKKLLGTMARAFVAFWRGIFT